jgi:hypothetical protein
MWPTAAIDATVPGVRATRPRCRFLRGARHTMLQRRCCVIGACLQELQPWSHGQSHAPRHAAVGPLEDYCRRSGAAGRLWLSPAAKPERIMIQILGLSAHVSLRPITQRLGLFPLEVRGIFSNGWLCQL